MNKPIGSEIWQRRAFRFAVVVSVVTLILAAGLEIAYQRQSAERDSGAKTGAGGEAKNIATLVAGHLNRIKPVVDKLAIDLTSGRLAGEELNQRLRELYDEHSNAWGLLEIGVAYEPAHNPLEPGKEFAPHFGIKDSVAQAFDVRDSYPYRESPWYQQTETRDAHWIEPYLGGATKRWTAGYAAPFYQGPDNEIFAGVVRINFDLDGIRELVATAISESLDETRVLRAGYVFLLSEDNKIITHPINEYVGRNIHELTEKDGTLKAIAEALTVGTGDGYREIVDSETAESYWMFINNVASTDWKAIVAFNRKHALDPAKRIRMYQRSMSSVVALFLCSLSFLVLRAHRGSEGSLWRFSVVSSVILFGGIIITWMLAVTGRSHSDVSGVQIADAPTAEATVLRHLMLSKPDSREVIRIPTGVFVQSLTFTSANNVLLTGYIWQRKPENMRDHSDVLGFILPEAEDMNRTQVYENDDVIGWYFETTLRQQFDYSRYPFDREDVGIRLWPESLNPNVVLIPDFASYHEKKMDGKPGVEKNFVLEGWMIKNSYFSYRVNSYNVDFGQPGFNADRSLELYFSVGLQRQFVGAFVSDMIPLIVIAFLAFAVLMSSTRHEDKLALFGFSTSAVLGYCAALFFVLIVGHVHLRTTLATQGIIYMEYFYFVMYFVILAVSTNSLIFASSRPFPLIHYNDNMIVKQLYWPLLAASLFVITLIAFL